MLKSLNDLLLGLQPVLILILGALIGISGSIIVWHKQNREERRKKRAELLLRTIDLTYSTGSHTRCLIYSKNTGIGGVLNLPENPVDKIMAIALIHFPDAHQHVQTLHKQQQELFGYSSGDPSASDTINATGEKMANTMNEIVRCLHNIAKKEKLNE